MLLFFFERLSMPPWGVRSSGVFTGQRLVSLIAALCISLPAGEAFAQARESIPSALFGGNANKEHRARHPARPATSQQHPAAQPAAAQKKPAGVPTQTPFGTIFRPLDSDGFVPFSEPVTAPLEPADGSGRKKPAPAAPAQRSAPQPAEPEPAPPPVATPPAPVPANVPLPPHAPAKRGAASQRAAPETPESTPANSAEPRTPATAPPANPQPVSNVSERQIIERANRFFNTLETMQAHFTQLGSGQRTTGTLYLERPGRIRFAYNAPSTLEIISDGKNVAIRDSKLQTSDVYAINQTPLKFLLRDPINLGTDLKVLDVVRDPTSIQIKLEDSSTIGGKAQITLFFDQQVQNLTRWTIVDAQGFTTTVILSQVKRTRRDG